MNYYDDPHDMKVMVAAIRRTIEIAARWPGNRKLGPLMVPPFLAISGSQRIISHRFSPSIYSSC